MLEENSEKHKHRQRNLGINYQTEAGRARRVRRSRAINVFNFRVNKFVPKENKFHPEHADLINVIFLVAHGAEHKRREADPCGKVRSVSKADEILLFIFVVIFSAFFAVSCCLGEKGEKGSSSAPDILAA
jgi:hypothetical protein